MVKLAVRVKRSRKSAGIWWDRKPVSFCERKEGEEMARQRATRSRRSTRGSRARAGYGRGRQYRGRARGRRPSRSGGNGGTVRVVVETATPQPQYVPGSLVNGPPHVQPVTPRRAKF